MYSGIPAVVKPDVHVTLPDNRMIGFDALSKTGKQWLHDNVQSEGWQYLGNILYIEAKDGYNVMTKMQDDGLHLVID